MTENYRFRDYCKPSVASSCPVASTVSLRTGEKWDISCPENVIIYIHYGQILLPDEQLLEAGTLFIVPPDCSFAVRAATTVSLLVMYIRKDYKLPVCMDRDIQLPLQEHGYQHLVIPDNVQLLFTLLLDEHLEGMLSPTFMELKVMELFVLLKAYYPKEKLATVFFPFLREETSFIVKIWNNISDVSSIDELASICGLSELVFQSKFKEIFGISPDKWITERKVSILRHELYSTNKQTFQIAQEQGFPSVSQLSNFCKKNLGHSPERLRKMYFGVWMKD